MPPTPSGPHQAKMEDTASHGRSVDRLATGCSGGWNVCSGGWNLCSEMVRSPSSSNKPDGRPLVCRTYMRPPPPPPPAVAIVCYRRPCRSSAGVPLPPQRRLSCWDMADRRIQRKPRPHLLRREHSHTPTRQQRPDLPLNALQESGAKFCPCRNGQPMRWPQLGKAIVMNGARAQPASQPARTHARAA